MPKIFIIGASVRPSKSYPHPRRGLRSKPRVKGTVIGINSDRLVRVQWDGVVTSELLSPDFIVGGIEEVQSSLARGWKKRGNSQSLAIQKTRQNRAELLAARRTIYSALMHVRRDPEKKELVTVFAKALSGSGPLNDEVLATAREINQQRL